MNRFLKTLTLGAALATTLLAPLSPALAEEGRRVGVAELSPEAESAIDKGLRYLASSQAEDGSWGKFKTGETAVALMAFMVKGHFPGRGTYGAKLDRAVAFLIKQGQEKGGFLGGNLQGMYEHGLATLALSEVWGESDNDQLRDTIKKAVDIILKAQNQQGGWRYGPQPYDADISATVMQIMALASARDAGILVPDETLNRAVKYVIACQHPLGGFAYQPGGIPGFARTAAGVMSLFMTGQRNSPALQRGLDYLQKYDATKFSNVSFYYYAHYYAIQCMYQSGEGSYQKWYPSIRDALLPRQLADGSWSGNDGGTSPAFGTSISILVLGVPYRFLPIYQR